MAGEALTELVPVSFAGLKTRFDEQLVDDDRDALEARVAAFIATKDVSGFARAFALTKFLPGWSNGRSSGWRRSSVRGTCGRSCATGAPTRGGRTRVLRRSPAHSRGDHRLRGSSTHASRLKLVFNLRAPAGGARDRRARMRDDVPPLPLRSSSCRGAALSPGYFAFDAADLVPISARTRVRLDARGVRARRRAPHVNRSRRCGRPPSAPRARPSSPSRRDDSGPRLSGQCGLDCHGDPSQHSK